MSGRIEEVLRASPCADVRTIDGLGINAIEKLEVSDRGRWRVFPGTLFVQRRLKLDTPAGIAAAIADGWSTGRLLLRGSERRLRLGIHHGPEIMKSRVTSYMLIIPATFCVLTRGLAVIAADHEQDRNAS